MNGGPGMAYPAQGNCRGVFLGKWTSSSFRCRSSGGREYISAFFRDCPLPVDHPVGKGAPSPPALESSLAEEKQKSVQPDALSL